MRILIITQGKWGERILSHLRETVPRAWQIRHWRSPPSFPLVLDDPEEVLPKTLPESELLIVLTESRGLTDLAPDIAHLSYAKAVIMPVDKRSWAPPGLLRQVKARLAAQEVSYALPMPFCSLIPNKKQHPLIQAFAERYGQPEFIFSVEDGMISKCSFKREAPCGNTRYVAHHLIDVPCEKAVEQAGLHHHYFPCWGGMEVDPVQQSHTLLHIAATIAQKSVEKALKEMCVTQTM